MNKEYYRNALYSLELKSNGYCNMVSCDNCPYNGGIENGYCEGDKFYDDLYSLIDKYFELLDSDKGLMEFYIESNLRGM